MGRQCKKEDGRGREGRGRGDERGGEGKVGEEDSRGEVWVTLSGTSLSLTFASLILTSHRLRLFGRFSDINFVIARRWPRGIKWWRFLAANSFFTSLTQVKRRTFELYLQAGQSLSP